MFGIESKIEQSVPLNVRIILRNLKFYNENKSNLEDLANRSLLLPSNAPHTNGKHNLSLPYAYIYIIGICIASGVFLIERILIIFIQYF